MNKKECIAMILAGGQGTRLGKLTAKLAKPAVPFGGKQRLIDFTLSNCFNSCLDTVGVLMPPQPFELLQHIAGATIYSLLPDNGQPYYGTANAIYANMPFIEQINPELVLILSGDHIYKMDYRTMLAYHKKKRAAATIAVIGVPWAEASRFGIMTTRADGTITEFTEKPQQPRSNLASMGIYIFSWPKLKHYLLMDEMDSASCHDFGKNIIPAMLARGEGLYAFSFDRYWKDVGTVESLYAAHMDLLGQHPAFSISDPKWPVYATTREDKALGGIMLHAEHNSLIHSDCLVQGTVEGTILFPGVQVGKNVTIKNSVIMPGVMIGEGAYIERAMIGCQAVIDAGCILRGGIAGMPHVAVVSENRMLSNSHNLFAAKRG